MSPRAVDLAGRRAERTFTVTDADTAVSIGSGSLPVLGTPRLVTWCEATTVTALEGVLEEGRTTVGSRVEADHLAPSPVGTTVRVTAHIVGVDGRGLAFAVTARDVEREIELMRARIVRVIVDAERFMARAAG